MGLVNHNPTQALKLWANKRLVFFAQQNIFEHRGVGQHDVRRILAYHLTSVSYLGKTINKISFGIFHWIPFRILHKSADFINLLSHPLRLRRIIVRLRHCLGKISVIHCIGQIGSGEQFLQPLFLILHKGIERIYKDCLDTLLFNETFV